MSEALVKINEGFGAYISCDMANLNEKEKATVYNAMSNPDKRLRDCINMEITIKDVFFEETELTDDKTGEVKTGIRVVLIDDKGVSYSCVSRGIFNACKRLAAVYGNPTWEPAVKVRVVQISIGATQVLSLKAI